MTKQASFPAFKLCLVLGNAAFFTSQRVNEQNGEHWDKVQYEDGAGEPYTPAAIRLNDGKFAALNPPEAWSADGVPAYQCLRVLFEASPFVELVTPSDLANGESGLSVKAINAQAVPWLSARVWNVQDSMYNTIDEVLPGCSFDDFVQFVHKHEGTVFVPYRGLTPYPAAQTGSIILK